MMVVELRRSDDIVVDDGWYVSSCDQMMTWWVYRLVVVVVVAWWKWRTTRVIDGHFHAVVPLCTTSAGCDSHPDENTNDDDGDNDDPDYCTSRYRRPSSGGFLNDDDDDDVDHVDHCNVAMDRADHYYCYCDSGSSNRSLSHFVTMVDRPDVMDVSPHVRLSWASWYGHDDDGGCCYCRDGDGSGGSRRKKMRRPDGTDGCGCCGCPDPAP